MSIKRYTVDICDACVNGEPGMCNEPGCAFCRRTDKEVRYILDATLIRAIVDGKPLVTQEGEEIRADQDIREAYKIAVERVKRLEDASKLLMKCQNTMDCTTCEVNCPFGEHIPTRELLKALEVKP